MYVYALHSLKDGKRYVGIAHDVVKRLAEHNSGRVFSTKGRRPFVIVHSELCGTVAAARSKEKYYKSTAGRRALEMSGPHEGA